MKYVVGVEQGTNLNISLLSALKRINDLTIVFLCGYNLGYQFILLS